MKPLIYLASPYSSEYQGKIEDRVRKVQTATAKLIEQGNLIFSPIVHSHPICDLVHFSPLNTAEEMSGWTQYDHDFIDHCDEVWVLMIAGWDQSRGVSDEIAYAYAHNIPVRFVSFPEIVVSTQTYSAFNPDYLIDNFKNLTPIPFVNEHSVLGQGSHIRTNGLLNYNSDFDEAEALLKVIFGEDSELFPEPASEFVSGASLYSPPSTGLPPKARRVETCELGLDNCGCANFPKDMTAKAWMDTYKPAPAVEPYTAEDAAIDQTNRGVSLPDDADERNLYPMAEGLLYYFPNALAEVSRISKVGAEQHLPGQPMHWARGKSTDHANKIIRHLIDAGKMDSKGIRHSAYAAWRILALLQEELEVALNLPLPKNARNEN